MALLQRLGVNDPDSVVDRHGWTLLMQAANAGLYELAELLVARKAHVNYSGTAKNAFNPLYLAVESEHTAVALLLLKSGAIASATKLVKTPSISTEDGENNDTEDEDCALFQACRFGQFSVIKEMLARGVDVNFALPSNGDRALHVSVMFGMQKVVELLVDDEAIDLNALNKIGQTCLFGCSCVELMKLLVTKGVDPKIEDIDGETALSMAHALGDDEVAAFLETVAM
uniref:Ankyrin n=1 Tax=Peronospora matthiolae TaxID=2874970 RepID=A0AAV1V602_9STRA